MTQHFSSQLIELWAWLLRLVAPPMLMSVAEWIEARMRLPDTSAISGRYSLAVTPYLREPLEALSDPTVIEVAGQKSAQIGWTMGVVMGWTGYTIDQDPASMIVMFPRDKTARDFNIEKFEPVVESSPALAAKIDVKSRSKDYRQDHKTFPGGFVKLVGSNSTGGVKSTSAKRLIVEEPDDCNVNLKGQGDSIELLRDRGKTYPDAKMLVGGTPTIKGVSSIEAEMQKSDQRYWYVPCHHCGEAGPLTWDQVRWSSDPGVVHPVYGHAQPETARYVCAACGGEWSSADKILNVARGEWRPTAPFRGIRGYYFNELMSPFAASALDRLVEKYLAAKHEESTGNSGPLISFWNGTLGLPWEYTSDVPEEDELKERALDYPELSVPAGGLILTAGIDVQHDRIAIIIRAWGRGEESWLVWWGEIFGNALEAATWDEVYAMLFTRTFRHASGAELGIAAATFDASDGQTDDAVYKAVRQFNVRLRARRCMAGKGSSLPTRDIFVKPAMVEVNARTHKAAKYGLPIYMIGGSRAKDLILGGEGGGRLKLAGNGPGRFHWYRGVRPDYLEQLLAEVKAPVPGSRKGAKAWQKKAGKRNEVLDCEVYALHAARSLRIDIYAESRWQDLERALLQTNLFTPPTAVDASDEVSGETPVGDLNAEALEPAAAAPASAPAEPVHTSAPATWPLPVQPPRRDVPARRTGGFSVGRWR